MASFHFQLVSVSAPGSARGNWLDAFSLEEIDETTSKPVASTCNVKHLASAAPNKPQVGLSLQGGRKSSARVATGPRERFPAPDDGTCEDPPGVLINSTGLRQTSNGVVKEQLSAPQQNNQAASSSPKPPLKPSAEQQKKVCFWRWGLYTWSVRCLHCLVSLLLSSPQ